MLYATRLPTYAPSVDFVSNTLGVGNDSDSYKQNQEGKETESIRECRRAKRDQGEPVRRAGGQESLAPAGVERGPGRRRRRLPGRTGSFRKPGPCRKSPARF